MKVYKFYRQIQGDLSKRLEKAGTDIFGTREKHKTRKTNTNAKTRTISKELFECLE